PPSLRTGRADLPHPALQSVVLPARGLTGLSVGCDEGEQPKLSKEGVGPAVMIPAQSPAFATLPTAQDAPQTHPDPPVQVPEGRPVAVFEVFKPASLGSPEIGDDPLQAVPTGPRGLGSDLVLQLSQALRARPAIAALAVIPQEVEAAWLGRFDDPGLGRMQPQTRDRRPGLDLRQ